MSNVTVCVRFRPLSAKEKRDIGDNICIQSIDSENFIIKDEKEEGFTFSFDKIFYEESKQADVYEFLVLPIVRDAVNSINGTIIAYGQTGAGKTYSMEGSNILESDEKKKGILPRVVDGLFTCIKTSADSTKYTIKLSMVEIYMEKVRDLFDLSKDNIQIKESKIQGILLSGATEISLSNPAKALQSLSSGIANRAIGETQMNMASSRSHCVYMFTIDQQSLSEKRVKSGKLVLVDLAGSEKVEKTGAEGRLLEEAKTINKSLSALGNVINALTCGTPAKASHIPYRDSKLTRLLQDALGGNSRSALLCCCSPSPSNASESLSTLRFGARARHIKTSPLVKVNEDKGSDKKNGALSGTRDETFEKILEKMSERLNAEDVKLLEELFIQAGLFVDLDSTDDLESNFQDVVEQTISSLMKAVEELRSAVQMLQRENMTLKERLGAAERLDALPGGTADFLQKISGLLSYFIPGMQR
ncbi:Kinesin-1-like protein PSS1 [Hibiscus syriacus]|uniref:Kinesin-like protein n=1 Tax=Hibiscus syriacus TaxID=106335 RepID=A0A6A3CAS8_HIBSY|nr:kinesin-like protein KIN-1 [Hibiscus syriacus]XP_039057751.1 kinesin-like protein KIN-1 [Hibiscus syriacus]KAE8660231.1 Kinesin-1-like protein PSS1 [Hibiscus syriacus]KAE8726375.1 Kinesin-1-like protein PSS1 [Hibiscus syriacus]